MGRWYMGAWWLRSCDVLVGTTPGASDWNKRNVAAPVADFEQIQQMLEAHLLMGAEFSLAGNRLANAQQYLLCGGYGAAQNELRFLPRSLEHGYRITS